MTNKLKEYHFSPILKLNENSITTESKQFSIEDFSNKKLEPQTDMLLLDIE